MKKSDVEIALKRAYKEKSRQINRHRLNAMHDLGDGREEEQRRLERAEQQIIGITIAVNEIQRKTGYTLKTWG